MAFMPRELVQLTLPQRDPGDVPVWSRSNGNLTVGIQPGVNLKTGESYGYPYGSIPRLLMFWMTTEALRNKQRRIELGKSLNDFIEELGYSADTGRGKRGDPTGVPEQMRRLFWARISFIYSDEDRDRWHHMEIAPDGELWWDPKQPDQIPLWGSYIVIGEKFFDAIIANPVPADIRALKALKKSPLGLDLYAWLTYEAFWAHQTNKSRFKSWAQLNANFSGYSDPKDFRYYAKQIAMPKILAVYPGLKLGERLGGIEVLPTSWPAIQPREPETIEGMWKTL